VATRTPPNSFAKLPIPTQDVAAGREGSALPVPLKTRVETVSTPRVTVAVVTLQPIAKKPLFKQTIREDASPVPRQTKATDAPPRVTVATRTPPNSFAKLPIPTQDVAAGREGSALPVPLKTRVETVSTLRVIVATRIQPNSSAKKPLLSPKRKMNGLKASRHHSMNCQCDNTKVTTNVTTEQISPDSLHLFQALEGFKPSSLVKSDGNRFVIYNHLFIYTTSKSPLIQNDAKRFSLSRVKLFNY